jgi:hypothetical protein
LLRRNPELLEKENAEFEAMTDAELAAIPRLGPSEGHKPPFGRFLSLPIGLLAVALLASVQFGGEPGHAVPISMLIAAAVGSRVFGGLAASRIAVALAAPISAYILAIHWQPHEIMWAVGVFLSFTGLCMSKFDRAAWHPAVQQIERASKSLGRSRHLG